MDYRELWYELDHWLVAQAREDALNALVYLDVLDKMDAIWNDKHKEVNNAI